MESPGIRRLTEPAGLVTCSTSSLQVTSILPVLYLGWPVSGWLNTGQTGSVLLYMTIVSSSRIVLQRRRSLHQHWRNPLMEPEPLEVVHGNGLEGNILVVPLSVIWLISRACLHIVSDTLKWWMTHVN